jgi:hypothetical protein
MNQALFRDLVVASSVLIGGVVFAVIMCVI